MKRPLFDTNVFLNYKRRLTSDETARAAMSAVVLYELVATTNDKSRRQYYEGLRANYQRSNLLLVPTANDWWEAAKLVSRLRFGDKAAGHGKTPPLTDAQRLQNDVLIARTAALNGCYVVTSNVDDFLRIKTFLNRLEVVSADDYFS